MFKLVPTKKLLPPSNLVCFLDIILIYFTMCAKFKKVVPITCPKTPIWNNQHFSFLVGKHVSIQYFLSSTWHNMKNQIMSPAICINGMHRVLKKCEWNRRETSRLGISNWSIYFNESEVIQTVAIIIFWIVIKLS